MSHWKTLLLRCFAWSLVPFASLAAAGTPLPLSAPDIPLGLPGGVIAVARQPDGGLILGGAFTLIDSVPRHSLARLHPDGTIDMEWNPSVNGTVNALAVDTSGDVYVGGLFDQVDGLPRRNIAKVSGSGRGSVDPVWNPGIDLNTPAGIDALTVNQRGDVFASGDISDSNASTRHVIKLSGSGAGTMDASWNPPLERSVTALVADANGAVYIASYGPHDGGPGCCLQKFSDSGNGAEVTDWRQSLDGIPYALALGSDGSLYAGFFLGFPLEDGRQHYLARFAPDGHGELDRAWDPLYTQSVGALTTDAFGAVYASLEVDGTHESSLVKLTRTPAGGADTEWQSPARGVRALTIAADGSLYVGGNFDYAWEAPPSKLSLARLNAVDGSALETVDALVPGEVDAIAFQADGGIVVGGRFARFGAIPRRNILRLDADGQLDLEWNPSLDFFSVLALAIDGDNNIYVGGSVYESQPVPVVKLQGTGTGATDSSWSPFVDPYGAVQALALDGQGAIYVGGSYSTIAGVPRTNIAKLALRSGLPDPGWNPGMAEPVRAIVIDNDDAVYAASGETGQDIVTGLPVAEGTIAKFSGASGDSGWIRSLPGAAAALARTQDGSLYVGGYFPEAAGSAAYVMKWTRDGIVDATWNDTSTAHEDFRDARALALDAAGNLFVAGQYRSGRHSFLTKLSGTGGAIVSDWNPVVDGHVNTVTFGANGNLHIGGDFSMVSGQPRSGIAALPTQAATSRPRFHGSRPTPILVHRVRAPHP